MITCHLKYCRGESIGVCSCGNTVCVRHDGHKIETTTSTYMAPVKKVIVWCVECRWKESK